MPLQWRVPSDCTDVVRTATIADVAVWLTTRALLNVIERSFAWPAWKLRYPPSCARNAGSASAHASG